VGGGGGAYEKLEFGETRPIPTSNGAAGRVDKRRIEKGSASPLPGEENVWDDGNGYTVKEKKVMQTPSM